MYSSSGICLLNRKVLFGALQAQDPGYPEIAVILFVMTPSDQVPAERIKYQVRWVPFF